MEERVKRQKVSARGAIISLCPTCTGTGKVLRELPFGANPKAPATRADKMGFKACPRCNGSGRVGVE